MAGMGSAVRQADGAPPLAQAPLATRPLARTAPLRALPRTAALAPHGFATTGIVGATVGAAGVVGAPLTPAATLTVADARSASATRRDLWLQASLYVALNVGDVISTYLGLRHGLSEGNPMMRALLALDGFDAMLAYKIAITLVVLAGLWLLSGWSLRAARIALLICNTLMAVVVVLNFAQFALPVR